MRILLINPNTSQATTEMMVAIAQAAAPHGVTVFGATARHGVTMIVDTAALTAAGPEVVEIGVQLGRDAAGVIVSAFGDPGLACLRRRVEVPVVGIAEAAMLEAAHDGRRFGVATVTPELAGPIEARAVALGLGRLYTGIRLTPGDPLRLAADPDRLLAALAEAVTRCIRCDGAAAVVIGGGPLGDAAAALARGVGVPVIAPIPAAVRRLMLLVAG
jgi:Asp/Glu/hydantoin racemase